MHRFGLTGIEFTNFMSAEIGMTVHGGSTGAELSCRAAQLRDQDRLLPVANIARIMVQELPEGTKISRDAKAIMQEAVSEFICFVVSEVADNCNGESKRTMHGVDIIEALEALGLAEGYGAVTRAMMPYLSSSSANSAKQKRSLSSDAHTTSLSPSSKRRPTMGAA